MSIFAHLYKLPKAQWGHGSETIGTAGVVYKWQLLISADVTKPLSGDNILATHKVTGKRMAARHARELGATAWNF